MKAQMVTGCAVLAPAEWQYYREIGRTHRTNLGRKSMEICWPISWSLEAVGLFKVVVSCSLPRQAEGEETDNGHTWQLVNWDALSTDCKP